MVSKNHTKDLATSCYLHKLKQTSIPWPYEWTNNNIHSQSQEINFFEDTHILISHGFTDTSGHHTTVQVNKNHTYKEAGVNVVIRVKPVQTSFKRSNIDQNKKKPQSGQNRDHSWSWLQK